MSFDLYTKGVAREKKALALAIILFINLILISTQIILKNRQPLLVYLGEKLVSPLQVALQRSSEWVSDQFQHYVFLKGIYQKYQNEKKKNLTLRHENFRLQSRLREFSALDHARQKFEKFLLVHVISVDTSFPFNTVIIDRGKNAGIRENMPVLNLEGELFGKTMEPISDGTATVRMITSAIGGVGAYLEKNMFEGFLAGNNSVECQFKYLLEHKPVQVGERVITSGNDLIFPPHIPIGKVVNIEKGELFPKITVRPFFLDRPIKDLIIILP